MSDTVSENFETFIILYLLEVKLLGSIDINENLFIQWISFTFFIPDRINHYNVITWWQYDVFHVEREQKRATEARSHELTWWLVQKHNVELVGLENTTLVTVTVTS